MHSSDWEPMIKGYADDFYEIITECGYGEFITYNKNAVASAFKQYQEEIHPDIMRRMSSTSSLIDRHKIISGYLMAFTNYPVFTVCEKSRDFYIEKNGEDCSGIGELPNEYFTLYFVKHLLSEFALGHKSCEGQDKVPLDYDIRLPDRIYNWVDGSITDYTENHLIKLLQEYGNKIEPFPVFTFANLLFFIEALSDCARYKMSHRYFSGYHLSLPRSSDVKDYLKSAFERVKSHSAFRDILSANNIQEENIYEEIYLTANLYYFNDSDIDGSDFFNCLLATYVKAILRNDLFKTDNYGATYNVNTTIREYFIWSFIFAAIRKKHPQKVNLIPDEFFIQSYRDNFIKHLRTLKTEPTKFSEFHISSTLIALSEINKNCAAQITHNLYNRKAFDEICDFHFNTFENISLIFIDIDKFKDFNTAGGEAAGNAAIGFLGNILYSCVENKENVYAARLGGEEFAIAVFNETVESVCNIAREIRDNLRKSQSAGELTSELARLQNEGVIESARIVDSIPEIKVSQGIFCCMTEDNETTYRTCCGKADAQLSKAKDGGRDNIYMNGESILSGTEN